MANLAWKRLCLLVRNNVKIPLASRQLQSEQTRSMSSKHPRRKFTVAVEGNIASGKTTFLQYFQRFPEVQMLQEPVDLWRNVQGHNLLDLMYKDPTRWSLTFQTYVQLTMIKAHLEPQSVPVKLMERSLFSAKYCFVENLHRRQLMPHAEYVVLTEWFDWLVANLNIGVDLVVYLRTTPEVVAERIRRRNRNEEQGVPTEYLRQLHALHEDWLVHRRLGTLGADHCQVLVLDANEDADTMCRQYEAHKSRILGGDVFTVLPSTVKKLDEADGDPVAFSGVGQPAAGHRVVKPPGEATRAAVS